MSYRPCTTANPCTSATPLSGGRALSPSRLSGAASALLAGLLTSTAIASPDSARIDRITCELAAAYQRGDLGPDLYIHLFSLRTAAHRAVLKRDHDPSAEHEAAAREAMARLGEVWE